MNVTKYNAPPPPKKKKKKKKNKNKNKTKQKKQTWRYDYIQNAITFFINLVMQSIKILIQLN